MKRRPMMIHYCAIMATVGVFATGCHQLGQQTMVGSAAEIIGVKTGVVAVAHAFNCELNGWTISRLNALHEDGLIPVRVALIGHDEIAVRKAVDKMGLAMPFRRIDQASYNRLASSFGVRAPFFLVLKDGWPQSMFGNIDPHLAFASLNTHLQNVGLKTKESS